jgi:hypothetical protein
MTKRITAMRVRIAVGGVFLLLGLLAWLYVTTPRA